MRLYYTPQFMDNEQIIKRFEPKPDNIIPLLHELQDNHPQNYLTEDALRQVARFMNVNLSWIYGVVGYYTMFSTKPRGKFIIRLCNSPVCHISGSENAIEWTKSLLKVNLNETTPDGLFTLEESECLGRCGKAPSMMINRDFYGELTKEKMEQIINELRKAK